MQVPGTFSGCCWPFNIQHNTQPKKEVKLDYRKIKDHNACSGATRKAMTWFDALRDVLGQQLACAGPAGIWDQSKH